MSRASMIISVALVLADLIFCFSIGVKTRGGAESTDEYFIGGKSTGTVLLVLTGCGWEKVSLAVLSWDISLHHICPDLSIIPCLTLFPDIFSAMIQVYEE